jgi:SAM-dependent methyltransferase
MAQPGGTWASGTAYEAYVGRWSRGVAARFLPALAAPRNAAWVDVGCGTGVLTAAVLEHGEPASVLGVDASPAFLRVAAASIDDPRARFEVGDAAALPVDADTIDVVVSGLVLNFLPDRPAALAEWRRVLRPGGILGLYVWDYAGEMQLMRHLWDAAAALDPAAADLDEGRRSSFCRPEPLRELTRSAGFEGVQVDAIDVPTVFRDFDDYWSPFLAGTGPAPAYVAGLRPDARERLRARLAAQVPRAPDGSIPLRARAWVVRARRPN